MPHPHGVRVGNEATKTKPNRAPLDISHISAVPRYGVPNVCMGCYKAGLSLDLVHAPDVADTVDAAEIVHQFVQVFEVEGLDDELDGGGAIIIGA